MVLEIAEESGGGIQHPRVISIVLQLSEGNTCISDFCRNLISTALVATSVLVSMLYATRVDYMLLTLTPTRGFPKSILFFVAKEY